jgi:hypothetical protein
VLLGHRPELGFGDDYLDGTGGEDVSRRQRAGHAPSSYDDAGAAGVSAPVGLLAEATKKAGLVWITVPGTARGRPAWHVWQQSAVYVLTGGSEQPLPGLVEAEYAEVTVPSKDSGGRLITWTARVKQVRPGTDEWQRVLPELGAKRLNALDSENQPERWARESTLLRLEPTGRIREAPGDMTEYSGAAPPPPTSAATSGPPPFVVGRARRSRRAATVRDRASSPSPHRSRIEP